MTEQERRKIRYNAEPSFIDGGEVPDDPLNEPIWRLTRFSLMPKECPKVIIRKGLMGAEAFRLLKIMRQD